MHSFYCWGQVGTVLVSTLFFAIVGRDAWPVMACLWALVPLAGIVLFATSPMPDILPEGTSSMKLGELVRNPLFSVFFIMMLCAGASELGISQWASTFAETGLGVSKAIGDLAGPAAFAVAGDLGCSAGPAIVGSVAAADGDNLQSGLLVGALFPVILLVGVVALRQILHVTRRAEHRA